MLDRIDADLPQLHQEGKRRSQLTVSSQMAGHPDRVGGEAIGTDAAEALVDHPQSIVDPWPIALFSLSAMRLAIQGAIHSSDQALPI